jgi:signal transduction histidine kinase
MWNKIKHYQLINLDITEQKLAEEALKNSQLELRDFASHLQNIREEEKIAIAREIHDDLGQILVALKIELGLFKHKISKEKGCINSEEILCKFDDLSVMVDKTIKTTRRIMTGLRPEIIDSLGFIEAAKSYVIEFEIRNHLPCQFNCTIDELNTTPQQSVALFRILQEALTNVVKHAKATEVKISISVQSGKIIMEINDNGIGFDDTQKGRQDSYGMIGMKERVILLEGELIITSKTGIGTSVKIVMPYLASSIKH